MRTPTPSAGLLGTPALEARKTNATAPLQGSFLSSIFLFLSVSFRVSVCAHLLLLVEEAPGHEEELALREVAPLAAAPAPTAAPRRTARRNHSLAIPLR
jgi:hypothetical protein